MLKDPHTVLPGRDRRQQEDHQPRRHHARAQLSRPQPLRLDDSVMRLPKEKIVFIVDTIPVGSFPGRGFIDIYPLETEEFIKKVIGDGLGADDPGHPGQPGGRLGTKKDAQDVLTLDAGSLRRDQKAGTGRQVLGAGREGIQAAEVRDLARL